MKSLGNFDIKIEHILMWNILFGFIDYFIDNCFKESHYKTAYKIIEQTN